MSVKWPPAVEWKGQVLSPGNPFISRSLLFNPQHLSKYLDSCVDFCISDAFLINFISISLLSGYSCVRAAGCFGPL